MCRALVEHTSNNSTHGGTGKLVPDPAFQEQFEANLKRMLEEASKLSDESTEEVESAN